MSTIPAAAVRKGDTVRVKGRTVRVLRVHNSDPIPGRIRWELATELGATRADLELSPRLRVELLTGAEL